MTSAAAPVPTPASAETRATAPAAGRQWWVLVLRGRGVAYMPQWVSPERPLDWQLWTGRPPELGDEL